MCSQSTLSGGSGPSEIPESVYPIFTPYTTFERNLQHRWALQGRSPVGPTIPDLLGNPIQPQLRFDETKRRRPRTREQGGPYGSGRPAEEPPVVKKPAICAVAFAARPAGPPPPAAAPARLAKGQTASPGHNIAQVRRISAHRGIGSPIRSGCWGRAAAQAARQTGRVLDLSESGWPEKNIAAYGQVTMEGRLRSEVSPAPSCPCWFSPQHQTFSPSMAQE